MTSRVNQASESIDALKRIFLAKGPEILISFFKFLYKNEFFHEDLLDFEAFESSFKTFNFQLSSEQIAEIFNSYQGSQLGKLSVFKFHTSLLGLIANQRVEMVLKKFQYLDYEKKGVLYLNTIQQMFRPKKYLPYANEAIRQFNDPENFQRFFNIYNNFIENKREHLNEVQFIDMNRYLSFFFEKDEEFEQFLENSWKKFYDYNHRNRITPARSQKQSRLKSAPFDLDERFDNRA